MENKNEIVEYSKDFAMSFNKYSSYELDMMVTLAYAARKKIKDHRNVDVNSNVLINLDPKIIKKMIQGNVSNARIEETLQNIFNTSIAIKKDNWTVHKHIFETLSYSQDKKEIIFELKKEYIPLFFNLSGNFTQHELLEFTGLKGKHAKRIYQIVMSYKKLKKWEIEPQEFLKILDVTYNWYDIEHKIIKKVSKELEEKTVIKNFMMERVKSGRAITKIILKWDIKDEDNGQVKVLDKDGTEAEIKEAEKVASFTFEQLEDLEKALEKAKKNRFIAPYLTLENIGKLTESFSYEQLKKGLISCYKNINIEIRSFSYIFNHIKGVK